MKVAATALTLSPSFRFVRGYYDIMEFEIVLRNDDPLYDVVGTQVPDVNYNFSVAIGNNALGEKKLKSCWMLKILNNSQLI